MSCTRQELAGRLILPSPKSPKFSLINLNRELTVNLMGLECGGAPDTYQCIHNAFREKVVSLKKADTLCTLGIQLRPLGGRLASKLDYSHFVGEHGMPIIQTISTDTEEKNVVILDERQRKNSLYEETIYLLKERDLYPQAVISLVGEYDMAEIEGSIITFFPIVTPTDILNHPLLR